MSAIHEKGPQQPHLGGWLSPSTSDKPPRHAKPMASVHKELPLTWTGDWPVSPLFPPWLSHSFQPSDEVWFRTGNSCLAGKNEQVTLGYSIEGLLAGARLEGEDQGGGKELRSIHSKLRECWLGWEPGSDRQQCAWSSSWGAASSPREQELGTVPAEQSPHQSPGEKEAEHLFSAETQGKDRCMRGKTALRGAPAHPVRPGG